MMSDEEKKAIKGLEWSQQQMRLGNLPDYDQGHYADIRIILNLIEKQQKTIDEMAGYLAIIRDCPNENCGANLDCENRCNNDDDLVKECWKMYFERKIENE